MAIYNKEESQRLAEVKAKVLVRDIVDGERVRVLRTVTGVCNSRSGKTSYWGVTIDKPLSDGCTGIGLGFIALVLP